MKLKSLIACFSLACIATSCIQDEALSSEAAIDGCTGSKDIIAVEINADARTVDIFVSKTTDCTKQSVKFTLPQGATIDPADGKEVDFTLPQNYTITSEDGKWSATYKVKFIKSDIPTNYHFEEIALSSNNKYQEFYDFDKDNAKALKWSSGNKGYEFTGVGKTPGDYPTAQDPKGKIGNCLKLVTRSTGPFGAMANMHIAAGNLFIGTFDANSALSNARKATLFGFPFYDIPQSMTGYYKFKAGEIYTEKGKPVSGKKDKCDIYAIFYETDDEVKMLDGDTSLSHENLVSIARINNQKETDDWTYFDLPFVMTSSDKAIDPEKLRMGKYNISIIFSSSIEGAYFSGAVGSTLYIDEVKLNYK